MPGREETVRSFGGVTLLIGVVAGVLIIALLILWYALK